MARRIMPLREMSMFFKQFYLGCLAHASYLIGDGGEAAVVDPRRDVDEYIDEARAQGLTIRWILETHLHADFVSGHRELAGAPAPRSSSARRPARLSRIAPSATARRSASGASSCASSRRPGHTPESISILVLDPEPRLVLTGDTLFIGDVGRPDLAASPPGVTAEDMAGAALRFAAREAARAARLRRGLPGARRGLALRPEHLERDVLHDRGPAPDELRAPVRCRRRTS